MTIEVTKFSVINKIKHDLQYFFILYQYHVYLKITPGKRFFK